MPMQEIFAEQRFRSTIQRGSINLKDKKAGKP
jgi:hypothetical protein